MAIKHSIVIPTYDRPAKLKRALRSCFEQTCLPAQVIVVDNGQNPATLAAFQSVAANQSANCELLYLQSAPFDLRKALANGIKATTQEWIILLDDDDCLLPDRIANDRRLAHDLDEDVVLIIHDFIRVDYSSHIVRVHQLENKSLDLYDALVLDHFPPPPAGTWRASAIKAYHRFDQPGGWTDFDLYASILSHGRAQKSGQMGYLMDDTRVTDRMTTDIEQTLKMVALHSERFKEKHASCSQGAKAVAHRLSQQSAFFTGKTLGMKAFIWPVSAAVRKHPWEAFKGCMAPFRPLVSRYLAASMPEMRGSATYTLKRLVQMHPDLYAAVNQARLDES